MITLDEMKLAVCEKLPGKITWGRVETIDVDGSAYYNNERVWKHNPTRAVHWPTEGLQVCHEAEKLLTPEQASQYTLIFCISKAGNLTGQRWLLSHLTWEQRLEALCRVWWPERFV